VPQGAVAPREMDLKTFKPALGQAGRVYFLLEQASKRATTSNPNVSIKDNASKTLIVSPPFYTEGRQPHPALYSPITL